MPIQTYVNALKSSVNIKAVNDFFQKQRDLTLTILQQVRPEGRLEGDRYKLGSVSGGAGGSFDFNLQSHQWGDWATNNMSQGLLGFLRETLKFSTTQVMSWLKEHKFYTDTGTAKIIRDSEGDALVFPIPEDTTWESLSEERALRKDLGIITGHWEYRDVDGALLGYKYRIDDRRSSKEVYTLTLRSESGWTKKAWSKKLLPAYGLEKLGASPNIRILFVEGEKAADKAQQILGDRWKVLSFSGVSATDQMWLPDDVLWESVEVVLWPDNDRAGREAMRKIQVKLDKMRHKPRDIRVVNVDKIAGLPAKWDIGDWEEGCGVDVFFEIENAIEIKSFDFVCQNWVYSAQQDQFYNLEDRNLTWSTTAFDRKYMRYADKNNPASKKFFSDDLCLKVDDLDFVPGYPTILHAEEVDKKYLNEWYPSDSYRDGLIIAKDENVTDEEIAEKAKYFIQHLSRVCGGEIVEPDIDPKTNQPDKTTEGRELVDALTWHFSELTKRPQDKRGWIPMLVSENNGTGKTYFRGIMAKILGSKRSRTVTVTEFVGEYHDWRDGTLFYELAETKSHDSTEVYEELKKLHSYRPFDPNSINDRGQNAENLNIKSKAKKTQRDFLNGYITSNHLFPIALANSAGKETGDRRLLVIRCEQILSDPETIELFDDELIHRPQWVVAYLLRYKARYKWNPSWAPITAHKRLMLEEDKIRSEARADKSELGSSAKTIGFIKFCLQYQVGCFGRRVFSFTQIKATLESDNKEVPYEEEKMTGLMKRAGVTKCDHKVLVNGISEPCYTADPEMFSAPTEVLNDEIKRKTNEPF